MWLKTGLLAGVLLASGLTMQGSFASDSGEQTTRGIVGTPGNDRLIGTTFPDDIHGKGGNDYIRGKQGPDVLVGGSGRDRVRDDRGQDRIYLGPGRDSVVLVDDRQYDKLRCGPGADKVWYRNVFLSMEQQYAFDHGCPWDWQKVPGS